MTKEIIFDKKTRKDRKLKNRLEYFKKSKNIGNVYKKSPSLTGTINGENFMAFERLDFPPSTITIVQNRKCMDYVSEDSRHVSYIEQSIDAQGWIHQLNLSNSPEMNIVSETMKLQTPKGIE